MQMDDLEYDRFLLGRLGLFPGAVAISFGVRICDVDFECNFQTGNKRINDVTLQALYPLYSIN